MALAGLALEGLYNCSCEVTFNDSELEDRKEVESLDNIELEIYPNPASNFLTLNIITDQIEINIKVYDLNGKEIFRKTIIIVQNGVYNLEITIGEVASGFYIVKVGNKNVTRNAKFIKI